MDVRFRLDAKAEVPKADVMRGLNAMHAHFYCCDTMMEVRPSGRQGQHFPRCQERFSMVWVAFFIVFA